MSTVVGSILVGIVPADSRLGDLVLKNITSIGDSPIDWVESSAPVIVPDESKDSVSLTLILQGLTPASPDCVVEHIQTFLKGFDAADGTHPICELWASAPAPLPMRSVSEKPWEEKGKDPVQTMREWGLFTHNHLLLAERNETIALLRENVDREIRNAEEQLAKYQPELCVGQDNFCFRDIASRSSQRFDLLITANEFIQSFVQSQVLGDTVVVDLLERLIGPDFAFDVSVVYSKPGAAYQGWHADGDHEKGSQDAGWGTAGWRDRLATPYAICLFLPLIDLDDSVGFTQFWPGSHRHRDLFGFGKLAELLGPWDGSLPKNLVR